MTAVILVIELFLWPAMYTVFRLFLSIEECSALNLFNFFNL